MNLGVGALRFWSSGFWFVVLRSLEQTTTALACGLAFQVNLLRNVGVSAVCAWSQLTQSQRGELVRVFDQVWDNTWRNLAERVRMDGRECIANSTMSQMITADRAHACLAHIFGKRWRDTSAAPTADVLSAQRHFQVCVNGAAAKNPFSSAHREVLGHLLRFLEDLESSHYQLTGFSVEARIACGLNTDILLEFEPLASVVEIGVAHIVVEVDGVFHQRHLLDGTEDGKIVGSGATLFRDLELRRRGLASVVVDAHAWQSSDAQTARQARRLLETTMQEHLSTQRERKQPCAGTSGDIKGAVRLESRPGVERGHFVGFEWSDAGVYRRAASSPTSSASSVATNDADDGPLPSNNP